MLQRLHISWARLGYKMRHAISMDDNHLCTRFVYRELWREGAQWRPIHLHHGAAILYFFYTNPRGQTEPERDNCLAPGSLFYEIRISAIIVTAYIGYQTTIPHLPMKRNWPDTPSRRVAFIRFVIVCPSQKHTTTLAVGVFCRFRITLSNFLAEALLYILSAVAIQTPDFFARDLKASIPLAP